jgi:hypothetical protein
VNRSGELTFPLPADLSSLRRQRSTEFSDFEVDWFVDCVTWKVNGEIFREVRDDVPLQPLTIRLNFWVPASDFSDAFSANL